MWIYLYLLTTSLHLQYGWTMLNLTTDIPSTYRYTTLQFPEKDWRMGTIYRFDWDQQYGIMDQMKAGKPFYKDYETKQEWYLYMNDTHIRNVFERVHVPFQPILFSQFLHSLQYRIR